MTVYAVMAGDKMVCLYKSPVDAYSQAKVFADKIEEDIRKKYGADETYEIRRKDNRVMLTDIYENFTDVWNYWVKSVDVLNKFKG